jgi:endonuclease YncB( thermonuclease family)
MGLLKIEGTLDLKQYWPNGGSDADTSKLIVNIDPAKSFSFREEGSTTFKATKVFVGATVTGKAKSPKKVISQKNAVTIRLQGIDAPELHFNLIGYTPSLPKNFGRPLTQAEKNRLKPVNKKFRQTFGETATVSLLDLLRKNFTHDIIPCTVTSKVDLPNDVCDTYGRIVGDISVSIKGKDTNLNHWLLEQGWAFPSMYNSMTPQEIKDVIASAKKGLKIKQNDIYTDFTPQKIGAFNFGLVYRDPNTSPKIIAEKGSVMLPKLYRRYCAFSIFTKAAVNVGTFNEYLKNKGDKGFYFVNDFLNKSNHIIKDSKDSKKLKQPFTKFFIDFVKNKTFTADAFDMIIIEDPSTLTDAKGKPVTKWF